MNKDETKLRELLQIYTVPPPSAKRMGSLISTGKRYMDSRNFNHNSFLNLLWNQLRYLPPSFWGGQTVLTAMTVILVCLSGRRQIPFHYPLTILSVIIPLLVLLGVREISKSSIYNMWEIEQSSICPLVKIAACRMLIVGLIDLFLVTGCLIGISCFYRHPIAGVILYGMVPFNISCSGYLLTVIKNENGRLSYHLFACMICLAAVFSFIMRQRFLFETSMLWGWGVFYLLSVILLGKAVQNYLKHETTIGEPVWNLS